MKETNPFDLIGHVSNPNIQPSSELKISPAEIDYGVFGCDSLQSYLEKFPPSDRSL